MTIYMTSQSGYIKIHVSEINAEVKEFIRSMQKQGYSRCTWFWWVIKRCWFKVKCWLTRKETNTVNIKGQRGLTISIRE